MSLSNPNEEYEDLIETPRNTRKTNGKISKIIKKSRFILIIIIIGIIIGILFGHYFIEPLLEESNTLENCLASKELLTKENECLYESISNPQELLANCST
jgi:hypothetical protein